MTQLFPEIADNSSDMTHSSILITEQIRELVNEFLGTEMIPNCAVGNELAYINGNLVLKTFTKDAIHGYRQLCANGELINIIKELRS